MSLLSALTRAYDRLPDAPPYGFSTEKIGFCIPLGMDGTPGTPFDLRGDDRKRSPKPLLVPQAVKRTAGIAPNFLWDKSAYVLGVTAGEGKRTAEEHAAFRARHLEWLAGTEDAGLLALMRFLETWQADSFAALQWPDDLRDQNIVFRLAEERAYLHERPEARALWRRIGAEGASEPQVCLVTGTPGPVARLHPSIKGVWGAQSSGASLVSFNLDAFTSYGHEQGDNAPVSDAAAFAYTTALNRFLADRNHRVQIGDTSTVFWADCDAMEVAAEADVFAAFMLAGPSRSGEDEKVIEAGIKDKLLQLRDGRPLAEIAPHLAQGVRMHLAGLAPNAARISVRFYHQESFGALADHYAAYLRDVAMVPAPDRPIFSVRAAILRSAPAALRNGVVKYDGDRVSPLLAGELTRAILTGARFPRSLLALLLLRVRSDHVLDRIRIALIKGLIIRDMRLDQRLPDGPDGKPMEDYLMRPDPDDPNPARRLGRLFALIERAQLAALGDGINATVADKFLGAACATPGRAFPALIRAARTHHIKRLRNGHSDATWIRDAAHAKRVGMRLDREIGTLWASLEGPAPAQHSSEEQGLFLVGYYQERYARRGGADADEPATPAEPDSEE